MSPLRISAALVLSTVVFASSAFGQSAPGLGGGNYDGHTVVTTAPAAGPTAVTTSSIWASAIVFRSFVLSAGGWWTAPAVIAPRVVPTKSRLVVRR